jgi:hypothetical protein
MSIFGAAEPIADIRQKFDGNNFGVTEIEMLADHVDLSFTFSDAVIHAG